MTHRYTRPHVVNLLRLLVPVLLALAMPLQVLATTCAGATVLNPATLPITNQALACGATNDLNSTNVPGTLCGTGDAAGYKNGNEALYRLTPSVTGPYTITVAGQTWSSIQVWAGCPNAGGTCVYGDGNAANTTTITVNLTAGVQYYIWFDTWPTPNSPCPGTFSIGPAAPPPANDNPCGATPLTVGSSCTPTASTTLQATATAGPPAPTCAFYTGGDVWFSMVVPASGTLILDSNTGVIMDGGMALYTAPSCSGPFTQVACDDDNSANGLMPLINASGLAPGSTVYVRFWSYGGTNNGSFTICAYTIPPPPPATGDNPCGANPLPVLSSCVPLTYSNIGATATAGVAAPACGLYTGGDVWFAFTAPSNGMVTIQTAGGTMTNGAMELYSAPSCAGPFTSIECSDDVNGLMPRIDRRCNPLTPGQTYYVRMWGYNGQQGSFNICAFQTTTSANLYEDCSGAIPICSGQSFNNNAFGTGCTTDLTTANQGCLASGERTGSWYYFTPSASGTIGFTITPAAPTDYDFAIWGPLTSLACPPSSPPLRCSWGADPVPTGCGNGATDVTEGAGGDEWVSTFNVVVGQVFIMYIDNFSINGQQFGLSWNLTNGASLDCTILPMELVELEGMSDGHRIRLEWATSNEDITHRYVVERSADGEHFEPLGTVDAMGGGQSELNYQFHDMQPLRGMNHYRLTGSDANGQLTRIASTTVMHLGNGQVTGPFPNPSASLLHVAHVAVSEGLLEVMVLDAMGRSVRSRSMAVEPGPVVIEVPAEGLPAGTYTVVVADQQGHRDAWPVMRY